MGLVFEIERRVWAKREVCEGPGGRAAVFKHVGKEISIAGVEEGGREREESILESVENGLDAEEVGVRVAGSVVSFLIGIPGISVAGVSRLRWCGCIASVVVVLAA
jgi:hypothetical protein